MDKNIQQVDLEACFANFSSSIESVQNAYSRLRSQLQQVNQSNDIPSEFLEEMAGNLAHGIRNPLGGITNFVTLLSDEVPRSGRVDRIKEGVKRIEDIVDRLVSFSQPIRAHHIKCNVVDIIHRAVESVSANNLNEKEISLDLPTGELYAQVDPDLIKQALIHLIQNAVEAMPEGGDIAISISDKKNTNRFVVAIRDQGEGLKGADLQKLFYPFYTTKANGMGLGLSLAKMFIEKHNGRISLDEQAGNGVTVAIELPTALD